MDDLRDTPAHHYSAALDSVNLINDLLAKPSLSDVEQDRLKRNVEHLEIILGRVAWINEDLTPLQDAIAAGKTQ